MKKLLLKPNLSSSLKHWMQNLIYDLAIEIGLSENTKEFLELPSLQIEKIRNTDFGDYACTVAMNQAYRKIFSSKKEEFRNPKNFALGLLGICDTNIESKKFKELYIKKVEVAGAGFINITLTSRALLEVVTLLKKNGLKVLEIDKVRRENIIFEYVSANPTGPLNVVSARAAALGSSCCNLLRALGHIVHSEFYVNDYGNQVLLLGLSLALRYFEILGMPLKFARKEEEGMKISYPKGNGLPFPIGAYHGEYIIELVKDLKKEKKISPPSSHITEKLSALSNTLLDEEVDNFSYDDFFKQEEEFLNFCNALGEKALEIILKSQKDDLSKFKTHFDSFFHESSLHKNSSVMALVDEKKEPNLLSHTYIDEGALYFKSTSLGDDKDRVLVRKDGRPTYFLADIAYHADKVKRGFTRLYNIWGPDHHGYIARMQAALKALNYKGEFRVILAQQVNLLEKGQAVKMSKRAGKMLTLKEMMELVSVDVMRYFFVMRSFDAPLDFDIEEARDTSDANPFYYVGYAHARICSIFKKCGEYKLSALTLSEFEKGTLEKDNEGGSELLISTKERRNLVLQLAHFVEELQMSAQNLEPHHLVNYLYNLAQSLSAFYNQSENRILQLAQSNNVEASQLLFLLEMTAFCLKEGLALLGAEAPEAM